jgi:hypothetical protein
MNPSPPLTKMEMIERSMRCFVWGLWGLLPIVGVPMALVSLHNYKRVKDNQGAMWNPAERYLFWGALFARIGLWPIFVTTVMGLIVFLWSRLSG